MKQPAVRWLLLALAVWLGAWAFTKWTRAPERADWQRPVSELSAAQRAQFDALRAAMPAVESSRSSGEWPATLAPGFAKTQQGLYVNYLGEAEGLRWLVLYVEPDPRVGSEKAEVDDEHHLLADGRMLHVSVWTQPLTEAKPENVTAWPAAEGWVQRVR